MHTHQYVHGIGIRFMRTEDIPWLDSDLCTGGSTYSDPQAGAYYTSAGYATHTKDEGDYAGSHMNHMKEGAGDINTKRGAYTKHIPKHIPKHPPKQYSFVLSNSTNSESMPSTPAPLACIQKPHTPDTSLSQPTISNKDTLSGALKVANQSIGGQHVGSVGVAGAIANANSHSMNSHSKAVDVVTRSPYASADADIHARLNTLGNGVSNYGLTSMNTSLVQSPQYTRRHRKPTVNDLNSRPRNLFGDQKYDRTSSAHRVPMFDPKVIDMDASAILKFLKENCRRDDGTYILRRSAEGNSLHLYDLGLASEGKQKQFKWMLAMLSYRFAVRLGQHVKVATPQSRLQIRQRQSHLFTSCCQMLQDIKDLGKVSLCVYHLYITCTSYAWVCIIFVSIYVGLLL
jgi:hypothetical protein